MGHRSHYVEPKPDSMVTMVSLTSILPPILAVSAVAYAILAVRVARTTPENPNNLISIFLFLVAGMVSGAALSYGATDANVFGVGRTLSFFSAGFVPVVFFLIYREFTVGKAHPILIALLCTIPMATTVLALTNSMHHMLW